MSYKFDELKIHFSVVFLLALLVVCQGCSKKNTAENTDSDSTGQDTEQPAASHTVPVATGISPAKQYEPTMAGEKIVGVWYGGVHLDAEKVKAKLDTLQKAEVRQQFMTMAETIESMRIATEFRSDGTMEIDIEIQPVGGQPQRASTVGTWRIIEQDANRVLIETIEPMNDPNQPDTKELVKQVQYTFIDKDHVAIPAPVSPDFFDCNPAVVFERKVVTDQPVERITNQGPTNIQK